MFVVIFYEMLTGKIAFEGPAVAQILLKIVNEMLVFVSMMRVGLFVLIDDVIEKGFVKDKWNCYVGVIEFVIVVFGVFGVLIELGCVGVECWVKVLFGEFE